MELCFTTCADRLTDWPIVWYRVHLCLYVHLFIVIITKLSQIFGRKRYIAQFFGLTTDFTTLLCISGVLLSLKEGGDFLVEERNLNLLQWNLFCFDKQSDIMFLLYLLSHGGLGRPDPPVGNWRMRRPKPPFVVFLYLNVID